MKRIHSLDYLRGVMAFLIMIYHYIIWVSKAQGAESFFGRVGIYGVAIFYILSGISLYLGYQKSLNRTVASLGSFYIRRFFRIYPLLWISMLCFLYFDKKVTYSFTHLALGISGLFGFVAPTKYLGLVSWSIGNELVFYTMFPILLLWSQSQRLLFFTLSAGLILVNLYFTFKIFDPYISLLGQWHIYVNPLNHVMLFVAGLLIADCVVPGKVNPSLPLALLLAGLCGLLFFPVSGDLVLLVQGWNRVFFTLCSCAICYGFYAFPFAMPPAIHKVLTNMGQTSYSIYLIHPIVFLLLIQANQSGWDLKIRYLFIIYLTGTLAVSSCLYYFVEKPMIKLGKRITEKMEPAAKAA